MYSSAFEMGREARLLPLRSRNNPFLPGSLSALDWLRGWRQEDLDCHDVVKSVTQGVSR
jgi:hypothetical protein